MERRGTRIYLDAGNDHQIPDSAFSPFSWLDGIYTSFSNENAPNGWPDVQNEKEIEPEPPVPPEPVPPEPEPPVPPVPPDPPVPPEPPAPPEPVIPDGMVTLVDNPDGTRSITLNPSYREEGELYIPTDIVVNHVEFPRTFKKGAASTVYLPVEIDTEANPDFYFYGDIHRSTVDESNIGFTRLYGVIPKNTPLLIYSKVEN